MKRACFVAARPSTFPARRCVYRCVASPPDSDKPALVSERRATRVTTPPVSESPTPPPLEPEPEPEHTPDWVRPLSTAAAFAGALALIGALAFASGPRSSEVVRAVEEFIEGPRFLVSIGMGASAFIQALTGFGFAIVSVGALTQLDWVIHSSVFDVVQPVAATLGAATGWALLLPELGKVEWRRLSHVLVASSLATPLGVLLLEHTDAHVVLRTLGALISAYVAYSLTGVKVPRALGGTRGAWFLGVLAGALGGAFDITGPPLVVHGEAAQWPNDGTFRRNVLAVVSVNSTLVVLYDALVSRLNDFYYWDFVKYAAPSVALGIVVGSWLSRKLDPTAFKKIVLGTCMALGAKLLLS